MNAHSPEASWVDGLSPGDHLCWIYETEEERRAVLVPFLRSGLQRGEKVVYIGEERSRPTVLGYLREAGVEIEAALASGQLTFLTPDDTYLRSGALDPDAMLSLWRKAAGAALAQGHAGLRVTGETGWVLRGYPGTERLVEYEARVTAVLAGTKCVALCQYDRRCLPPELLLAVARTHPMVVVGTALHECFYRITPEELLGPNGAEAELSQFLRSLSAQTEKVNALRQSEERYRAMVEDGTDLICRFLPDGTLTFVNSAFCRHLGRHPQELLGVSFMPLLPEDARAMIQAQLDSLGTEVRTVATDYPAIRADGTITWQHWVGHAIHDAAGNVVEFQAVGRDITERKRMECEIHRHREHLEEMVAARTTELQAAYERLQVEERRKDEFLAMLAHELRNPLGAIGSAAHLLRLRQTSGRSLEPALDVLQRQVRNMAHLLDDLLDVSRVTRGKVALHKAPIDAGEAIRHAVETARPLIEANHHTLVLSLPPDPVRVEADPTRLEQIVANLVNNAAKYTMPEGEIAVSLEHEGGEAVVRVCDTGIGISPELLPHVFDLFVQGGSAPAGGPGGLGIGLTLVRDLVELHGGTVEARSEGVGSGSEFVVRLPVLGVGGKESGGSAAASPLDSGGPGEADPADATGLRVLLVEDDADQARMLAGLLRSSGHAVCVARDGTGGLTMAEAFQPHVALLDIRLPGIDGYEVARRIRAGAGRCPLLVALTGYGQEEDQRRAVEAGFDRHLTKPVDLAALHELLAGTAP